MKNGCDPSSNLGGGILNLNEGTEFESLQKYRLLNVPEIFNLWVGGGILNSDEDAEFESLQKYRLLNVPEIFNLWVGGSIILL